MKKEKGKATNSNKNPDSEKTGINPFTWVVTGFVVVIAGILIIDKMNEPDLTPIVLQDAVEALSGSGSAPDFELVDLSGSTKSLADYSGKVVMLNFWATWCGPCKREIPDFIELQDEYRDQGFEIVGISLDDPAKTDEVARFSRDQGINYDVLYGHRGVAEAYGGVRSIPTTFLIDRSGAVVASITGVQPKNVWTEEIEKLL